MEIGGRVAVVTGAAVGIGQAIAGRFAKHGARLVLADVGDCTQTLRMMQAAGAEAIAVTADLRGDAAVGLLVDEAVQRFGGLDILVRRRCGRQVTGVGLRPNVGIGAQPCGSRPAPGGGGGTRLWSIAARLRANRGP
jgi:hypothetical protein